jgi:hypothetical protein
MIKKIIVLLWLILSFINYSKAWFNLIWSWYSNSNTYKSNEVLIWQKYYMIPYDNMWFKIVDKWNIISECKFLYFYKGNPSYDYKIFQLHTPYWNIIVENHISNSSYQWMWILFVNNDWTCLDTWDLKSSNDKNTIAFAWKLDKIYVTDEAWTSDYWYVITLPIVTWDNVTIEYISNWFNEILDNNNITTMMGVWAFRSPTSSEEYNKYIKDWYIYWWTLHIWQWTQLLNLYWKNVFLSYKWSTEEQPIVRNVTATWYNLIFWNYYLETDNEVDGIIFKDVEFIDSFIDNGKNAYVWALTYNWWKFTILKNSFRFKYLSKYYTTLVWLWDRENANIESVYFNNTNYKMIVNYNKYQWTWLDYITTYWEEWDLVNTEDLQEYTGDTINLDWTPIDNWTTTDWTTTDWTITQEELDFWDATASFFTNLVNIVIDATTTPYENYEKLKEMINNLHSQEYVCNNTTWNNEIVVSMSNVHNSWIDYLKTILYVLASIGWIYFLFIKM